MFQKIKKCLYFSVASYFKFFASIKLKIWGPKIIVITGSSGKTTLLHMVESQLGDEAKYSHEANSSFGIPFDILGIHRKDLTFIEWPIIFLSTPFRIFGKIPQEKTYVVEADCDRPYEGKFLSSLLNPEITLWTNISKTHSMNFDRLIENKKFKKIEDAISFEFGFFAEKTKKLLIIDGDDLYQSAQLGRTKAKIIKIFSKNLLKEYKIGLAETKYVFEKDTFSFKYLLPKEVSTSILMVKTLSDYLNIKFDRKFNHFRLPPGRSSCFKGIKDITIIDSTYNANFNSMSAVIKMFAQIESPVKWVVLGDMLEQGKQEKEEHEKLAMLINGYKFEKIVLMGPRISKYTKPFIKGECVSFLDPKEVLDYLEKNIQGRETILFKGARFLEGVIEHLLTDKNDIKKLPRREKVWEIRRKKWSL